MWLRIGFLVLTTLLWIVVESTGMGIWGVAATYSVVLAYATYRNSKWFQRYGARGEWYFFENGERDRFRWLKRLVIMALVLLGVWVLEGILVGVEPTIWVIVYGGGIPGLLFAVVDGYTRAADADVQIRENRVRVCKGGVLQRSFHELKEARMDGHGLFLRDWERELRMDIRLIDAGKQEGFSKRLQEVVDYHGEQEARRKELLREAEST